MTLLETLQAKTDEHLAGQYTFTEPREIPLPEDIPLGGKAAKLEATALFIDIRQSTDLAEAFQRQTAAKMMKAYFDGAVRIIGAKGGQVRSFNGDGMLALFIGDSRRNDAVSAAMQVDWFVGQLLRPKLARYFSQNAKALGRALDLKIGCGLDDGHIYAVRIGIRGTNDVAWIGRCTNTAAKLSNIAKGASNIMITGQVYSALKGRQKESRGRPMWSEAQSREIGGVLRSIRSTNFHRSIT
jgi:class 3 adenylate cyclase